MKDSPFKDDKGGFRTLSLFLEIDYDKDHCMYTLKDYDHEWKGRKCLSLKLLYLEMADPTEYAFAEKYFYNWSHWQKICRNTKLKKYVDEWRDELEVKLKSLGVRNMISTAYTGSSKDMTAASKWLSDKGWDKRKAGAPTAAETVRQQKIHAGVVSETDEDFERIMGKTLN